MAQGTPPHWQMPQRRSPVTSLIQETLRAELGDAETFHFTDAVSHLILMRSGAEVTRITCQGEARLDVAADGTVAFHVGEHEQTRANVWTSVPLRMTLAGGRTVAHICPAGSLELVATATATLTLECDSEAGCDVRLDGSARVSALAADGAQITGEASDQAELNVIARGCALVQVSEQEEAEVRVTRLGEAPASRLSTVWSALAA